MRTTLNNNNLCMNPVVKVSPFSLCLVVQNRGRLAEKRTIPLPPNRLPKKELSSIFSSDDSEGSERASGDHAHIKQEEELHYSIMRKRWGTMFDIRVPCHADINVTFLAFYLSRFPSLFCTG